MRGLVAKGQVLVKKFRADVSECRPGDQHGRDESKDTEHGNDQNQVTTFYIIHKTALSFHDVLLSNVFTTCSLLLIKLLPLKIFHVNNKS